jgi:hypothetical protein
MISELKDEEIMNFLMTSEFEDDYKPEELKYLLFKFRYFYRILHGRHELVKSDGEFSLKNIKEESDAKDNEILRLRAQIANGEDILNSLKSRKLTFKERFSGKIIMKDENK